MTSFRYGYWLVFVNVTQIRATGEDRISTEELSSSKQNKRPSMSIYIWCGVTSILFKNIFLVIKILCLVIFFRRYMIINSILFVLVEDEFNSLPGITKSYVLKNILFFSCVLGCILLYCWIQSFFAWIIQFSLILLKQRD